MDTEVCSFDPGVNFLTFTCLKNVNCKRNATLNFATPAVLEAVSQFAPRDSIDTVARSSNRGGFGRPGGLREAAEEDVLQSLRDNPHTRTRAATRDLGIRNHVDVGHVVKDNHLFKRSCFCIAELCLFFSLTYHDK